MKKKMLTIAASLILVLSVMLGAVACNPFDDDKYGKDNVKGKITLRVAVLNSDAEMNTMVNLKRAYEAKNELINIKIEPIGADYDGSMLNYINVPTTFPDVLWVPGEYHSPYSSAGHFVNLKDWFERDFNRDDYYESILGMTKFSDEDTGMWFAPRDYNKLVVFINRKMFGLADVPIPKSDWTMDDFYECCRLLRNKMNNDKNTTEEKYEGLISASVPVDADLNWYPSYMTFINHYGGKLIDTTKTGAESVVIDSLASKNAYKAIYNDLPLRNFCSKSDTSSLFPMKKAAMWVTVRPELQQCINLGLDVDFLPMPTDKVAVGCSGYAIPEISKTRLNTTKDNTKNNAELAWEFISYILSEDGQNVLGSTGTGIPVLKSLAESGSWLEYHDKDLNHKAFTMNPEKDLTLTDFYIYKPVNHLMILGEFDLLASTINSPITWSGSPLGGAGSGNSYAKFEEAIQSVKTRLLKYV